LSEKESVIRRVEEEKMVPDERLAKKLERFLGVKLSEEYRQEKRKLEKRGKLDLTLGDVVEIK
jgi:putative transcription factor